MLCLYLYKIVFRVKVTVGGPVDEVSGMVMNLAVLKVIIEVSIIKVLMINGKKHCTGGGPLATLCPICPAWESNPDFPNQ